MPPNGVHERREGTKYVCGIAGFYSPRGVRESDAKSTAIRMLDSIKHRGPNDSGVWLDADAGIALGHRRLSILDLSPSGHQPMLSVSSRYVIAFNGEIYNHQDLRKFVEGAGHQYWRGTSDTESLLAIIDNSGLEKAIEKLIGMFAFAIWDRQERRLSLARDRMGEKPLYYGWNNSTLFFASELKAFQANPEFCGSVDADVLPVYLRHGYIPAPWTIWKGIRKLTPGCMVHFSTGAIGELPEPVPYWSFASAAERGQSVPFQGSDNEAIDLLESHMKEAVASQMVADVPVGAFLSGGIDSSAVVAIMQSQSSRPIKTFTIGFDENGYNEAHHAKAVAAHLGTEHTELYVNSDKAQEIIPKLPFMFDEPFGDSSAIPTYLVSLLAKQQVTVSLSGDGGDELFGGYSHYLNTKTERIWRLARGVPRFFRDPAAGLFQSHAVSISDFVSRTLLQLTGRRTGESWSAKISLAASLFRCDSFQDFNRAILSQWSIPPVARPSKKIEYGLSDAAMNGILDPVQRMMATDSVAYLPDDILVKVDRAAMSVSLETRVPMLDHRLVELAWRMPYKMKVREGEGKWLLRQVLYRYAPRELFERPKMGFGVPVDEWIRGPLRDWAEELLSERRLKELGMLDPKPIRDRWKQHLLGHHNWRDSLWLVLMWQAWMDSINHSN